ncbi:hypothetical protein LCGC14_0370310 [marine sediment metagenome]|uniref:Uncharacterized protein n=1 Tax=marine sediment metagenome TaxID=412755 RepID=A0A0F9TNN1_9ZZZZ
MIDQEGRLRCDHCKSVIGEWLEGKVAIKCWRSNCKTVTIFDNRTTAYFEAVLERQLTKT